MQPNLQPNLENDLVLIRPLKEQDFETLYNVAKDPLIWEQHPVPDRYKRDKFKPFFKDSLDSKGALVIIDKLHNDVIGSSRYKKLDSIETAVEIGWTFLSRKYWGGKYNSTVKSLMINHAFKYFEEIIFYATKSNNRSRKAIEKIGGKEISDPKYQSPTMHNDVVYRLRKTDCEHLQNKAVIR